MTTTTPSKSSNLSCWIEAMRLRTLPVSVAGVLSACAMAMLNGSFKWMPAVICLLFAILAQIASNFGNEYFDFRDGLDKKGRVGPRRGVTEGDITPRAMLTATLLTLGVAAMLGLSLIYWGGWWLIVAGVLIIMGALAYSTGPYPLSRHGWGEVAVIVFFGLAPVTLSYYLQTGECPTQVWMVSVAIGLLGANVLISNNYRDIDDDRAVGKMTLAVKFGPKAMQWLYLANGIAAWVLLMTLWHKLPGGMIPAIFQFFSSVRLWRRMRELEGRQLVILLASSAKLMLIISVVLLGYGIANLVAPFM